MSFCFSFTTSQPCPGLRTKPSTHGPVGDIPDPIYSTRFLLEPSFVICGSVTKKSAVGIVGKDITHIETVNAAQSETC